MTAKKDYEEEKDEHEKEKKKIAFENHIDDLQLLISTAINVYGNTFFSWNALRI